MKTQIITILGIILTLSLVSAISLFAGESYSFSIDTTEELFYEIMGNSSNTEGFYVYQDIYSDYSNITFSTDINFASDSFTVILFPNTTNEVIVEVPSDCPSCGGGGGSGYYDPNWNKTQEPETNQTITITDDEVEEEIDEPIIEEKESIALLIILIIILILIIFGVILYLKPKK